MARRLLGTTLRGFKLPRWMIGSAAGVMAKELQEKGNSLPVPPESFFVKGKRDSLRSGELDRATTWARMLLERVESPNPVVQ